MGSRLNREVFVVFVGHLLAYAVIYWFAEKKALVSVAVLSFTLALLAGYLWYRERRARLACTPFSEQILHSPYGFQELTEAAKSSIFVAGPSLKFIATEMKIKDSLFGKCGRKDFKIRILISNPEEKDICSVLERVSFTPGFCEDLANAFELFRGWKNDSTKGRTAPLDIRIRKTDVLTMSLIAIDAEQPEGFLVVVPIPWKVYGGSRPCFVIEKKRHPAAFGTYYNSYHALFEEMAKDI